MNQGDIESIMRGMAPVLRDTIASAVQPLIHRLIALEVREGRDGVDAYPGEARGLYDAEATYRALDVVSLNGSEWRAKKDDPGPLPGDGWMLSAQKGKRGDKGASFSGGYLDKDTFELCLQRDDGEEVVIDLSGLRNG